jgi:hypothetical protein
MKAALAPLALDATDTTGKAFRMTPGKSFRILDGVTGPGPTIKKAAVALARKLAVIMHRMLADGTPFTNQPA